MLYGQHHPGQVHPDDMVPRVDSDVFDARIARLGPGIGKGDVEAAEFGVELGHQGVPRRRILDAVGAKDRAGLAFDRRRRFGIGPGKDDPRPLAGQPGDRRGADPARPAGDQSDLAAQPLLHPASPLPALLPVSLRSGTYQYSKVTATPYPRIMAT